MIGDNDNELPRTRAEALAVGSVHYFTGEPCKHGHFEERTTSSGQCRECARISQRAAYPARAEKLKAYQAEYRQEHREEARATTKKWRENNPERAAESIRRWREENPDYRVNNLEHLRAKDREYSARQRSTPKGRVDDAISAGIRGALKRGQKRGAKWELLVGYTVEALMSHLEKQFQPGMTWENYGRGGWNIDHKIPRAVFNYETPEDIDFKRCWALENLQPLWELDNISKGAKLGRPFQPSLAIPA